MFAAPVFASILIFGSTMLAVPYFLFRNKSYRKELAQARKDHKELDTRNFESYLAVTNEIRNAQAAYAQKRGIIEKQILENQAMVSR